ncbi:MAG TPA: ATP-binding cassette domain-containing protein [Cyclobacteriaceae bacterium]|jgi:ABC-type multidrug transport system ATPase subunit|nr:ATP-binding cassette domain-containing protein [Cyclobacteriaceae bacterium]
MKVVAENLGKRFNREWVFRNFNYEFNSGNRYVITGPNGSGKSTLMQVLWGQMQPSTGSVKYSVPDPSEIFKSVAIATPYMDLIEEFNLEEMINFHFKFKKCRIPVEEVLRKSELESSRLKPISTFSSGMKQRLKLALAFYSESELLFLDEPCTNLDKKSITWYHANLSLVPKETLVFIASNQEIEYPATAVKIDILSYK